MAIALAYRFLPALLLAASAALYAWKWELAWTRGLAAIVAVGVAGWQVYITLHSMRGQAWDPPFHGFKLGMLAVAVAVDLAAAWSWLRPRLKAHGYGGSASGDGSPATRERVGSVVICVFLLMLAAVLYSVFLPFLATTGE
jgi:uncharacterized membrane protein YidH (DUF202 family)